jgi:hypothetical protein
VKIEERRLTRVSLGIPGDQPLAIGRLQDALLDAREAELARQHAAAIGKVDEFALAEIGNEEEQQAPAQRGNGQFDEDHMHAFSPGPPWRSSASAGGATGSGPGFGDHAGDDALLVAQPRRIEQHLARPPVDVAHAHKVTHEAQALALFGGRHQQRLLQGLPMA